VPELMRRLFFKKYAEQAEIFSAYMTLAVLLLCSWPACRFKMVAAMDN